MAITTDITVRILAHRQNVRRYRSLLRTQLTDVERAFVERRIGEEETEVSRLSAVRKCETGRMSPGNVRVDSDAWVIIG